MSKMQAEAATTVPANAPIAAYLDHLPQPLPADLLGYLIATEAKAVHQVPPMNAPAFKAYSLCLYVACVLCALTY